VLAEGPSVDRAPHELNRWAKRAEAEAEAEGNLEPCHAARMI